MLLIAVRCGVGLPEFWSMTPFELELVVEAAGEQEAISRRWQATMVANLINCVGRPLKRAITAEQILGIAPPRLFTKKNRRTAAQVMQEDAERAKAATT